MESERIVLPYSIKPIKYDLVFVPNLKTLLFTGRAKIEIEVLEPVSEIVFNAKELELMWSDVVQGGRTFIPVKTLEDKDAETVTLIFAELFKQGMAELKIGFAGQLTDSMRGFYRSAYEVNGKKKYMATTQFEATDTRRAFPCWDEPAQKAKFDLTLVIPKNLGALSNMPVEKVELFSENKVKVKFQTTPIMSPYLLAFMVGEFERVVAKTKDGVLVSVFTTPGKKDKGQFALDVAVKSLEFYNEYFGVPYPLPKLDLVAIPDFAAGAMENWGLVTYRETTLLVDPENSSLNSKRYVAIVVAHELAHQWFGNLVTMEWWDDLWLNEGFASFMEYVVVDKLFPTWNIWNDFIADSYASALADDGLRSTHAIEVPVKHPDEINQIFDSISYEKGASVIRMLENYLGMEIFRLGLHHYLAKHKYKNASTDDLWLAFEEVSGKKVKEMMNGWTRQPGYPVISLENDSDNQLRLRQRRFISSELNLMEEEKNQKWIIPLSICVNGQSRRGITIVAPEERFINWTKKEDWFKLNAGQIAFARINYPPEVLARLKQAVSSGSVDIIDRFGIIDDLRSLTSAGMAPATRLLDILEAYRQERSHIVWGGIVRFLNSISHLFPDSDIKANLYKFARHLLAPIVEYVGWDALANESYSDSMLRPAVVSAFGYYGDLETTQEAKRRFNLFINNRQSLDPNLRSTVYRLVARGGDNETYERFVKLYKEANLQEEKTRFLIALGYFHSGEVLRRALDFSFSEDVRKQDCGYLVGAVFSNSYGREIAWDFIKSHWSEIEKRFFNQARFISEFVSMTSRFISDEKAREVEDFFKEHPVPNADRALAQSLEAIRKNSAWRERDLEPVRKWLASKARKLE